jgi:glycosyltransferase involved in cell wall biosynthesis
MVMRAGRGRNWGGEIRRARIFQRLAERTDATVVDGWPAVQAAVRGRFWQPWRRLRPRRPMLAASEGASPAWLDRIDRLTVPVAVAIYDDIVAQSRALGLPLTAEREAELRLRRTRNERAFRWHVVPTRAFAEAFGLDLDRIIVGRQGTVTEHVVPGPWPDRPAVGIVSGASPGRGIESLIAAMQLVRETVRDVTLYLWLSATSSRDEAYADELRTASAGSPWIQIATAPYADLGPTLAKASVLTIPHPAVEYMDVILPVKLFDSLAAGRPLVVTPRTETVAIVEPNQVGLVTADDRPESIAAAILRLLEDQDLARSMGTRARELAVREFDWGVLGDRIADEILRREGLAIH